MESWGPRNVDLVIDHRRRDRSPQGDLLVTNRDVTHHSESLVCSSGRHALEFAHGSGRSHAVSRGPRARGGHPYVRDDGLQSGDRPRARGRQRCQIRAHSRLHAGRNAGRPRRPPGSEMRTGYESHRGKPCHTLRAQISRQMVSNTSSLNQMPVALVLVEGRRR